MHDWGGCVFEWEWTGWIYSAMGATVYSLGPRIFLAYVSNVCIKIPEKIAMFGKRKKKKRLHDPHELLQFFHNAGKVFANLKIHYKMSLFYRRSCSQSKESVNP